MILDAREANQIFARPPGVALCTSEALGNIEINAEEANSTVYLGVADIADAFHRFRAPTWMRRYFALERPVKAGRLGLVGKVIDGRVLTKSCLVWPMFKSLPMGFSWSLYFCQEAGVNLMSGLPCLGGSRLMSDRSGATVVSGSSRTVSHHYVYVDNLGAMSGSRPAVEDFVAQAKAEFGSRGLVIHEAEIFDGVAEVLGVVVDGKDHITRISPKRLARVRAALSHLLGLKRVPGKVLEIILGHCTFCALACRPLLSVFHSTYAFVRRHACDSDVLWPAVRSEVQAFRALTLLAIGDWSLAWSPYVSASDASPWGYGISSAIWPPSVVAQVGRVSERSRFRRSTGLAPRESALTSAGFKNVGDTWEPEETYDSCLANALGEWEIDEDFPEVPAEWLRGERWKACVGRRWKHREDILILEARTLVSALARLVEGRRAQGSRFLFLSDNMSVVLAFSRSRARDFKLLCQVRKFAGYLLAKGNRASVRWVPSELNSSDIPFRSSTPV